MKIHLPSALGELVLELAGDRAASGDARERELAERALRSALRDPIVAQRLRLLLRRGGVLNAAALSHAELLTAAGRELARGGLVARAEARPAPPALPATAPLSLRAPERPVEEEEGLHFIEVVLLGEDGRGIEGELCRVETPADGVFEGRTDGDGLYRVNNIRRPGECTVTFPNLDAEAWEAA